MFTINHRFVYGLMAGVYLASCVGVPKFFIGLALAGLYLALASERH